MAITPTTTLTRPGIAAIGVNLVGVIMCADEFITVAINVVDEEESGDSLPNWG